MGFATPEMVRDALRVSTTTNVDKVRIDVTTIEDWEILRQITESDALVTTYLSGKAVSDVFVASLSRDVAAYLLVLSWRGSADLDGNDPVVLRYRHAMAVLEDIGTGKVTPVDANAESGVGAVWNPNAPCLVGTDVFGRPVIVDRPPRHLDPLGYPGGSSQSWYADG